MIKNQAKKEILEKTQGGLDIFKYYLPGYPIPSRVNFKSPFYEDGHAACNVFQGRDGIWRFKDHGEGGQYSGDAFWLVATLNQLDPIRDFPVVLDTIIRDMSLNVQSPLAERGLQTASYIPESYSSNDWENTSHSTNSMTSHFEVKKKGYSLLEKMYWKQYGITEDVLERYHVYSLESFSSVSRVGRPYTIKSSKEEPMFLYDFGESVKVYRPKSTKCRFLNAGERSGDYVFGYNQLPRTGGSVIITGGEKDVMSLAAQGFNAITFNSETALPSKEIVMDLSRRFKFLFVCYDADSTGLEASVRVANYLRDYKVIPIYLPLKGTKQEKDISDFCRLISSGSHSNVANVFKQCANQSYERYLDSTSILTKCLGSDFNESDFNILPSSGNTYRVYDDSNNSLGLEIRVSKEDQVCVSRLNSPHQQLMIDYLSHNPRLQDEGLRVSDNKITALTISNYARFERSFYSVYPTLCSEVSNLKIFDSNKKKQLLGKPSAIVTKCEQQVGTNWKKEMQRMPSSGLTECKKLKQ